VQIPLVDFMTQEEYLERETGIITSQPSTDVLLMETSDVWLTVRPPLLFFFDLFLTTPLFLSLQVTDSMYILTQEPKNLPRPPSLASLVHSDGHAPVRFIWTSEKTGFRQLYLVERTSHNDRRHIRPLTAGEWQILETEIWVDEINEFVYFMAKKDTPLGRRFPIL